VAAGCSNGAATAASDSPVEAAGAAVTVLQVQPEDAQIQVQLTGNVAAENVFKVAPQMAGEVAAILVEEGQDVTAGQVLVLLDDEEVLLRSEQAAKAKDAAVKRLEQLELVAEIEAKTLALGVKQAEEALRQVQARAEVVETGARPQEREQAKALADLARTRMESARREVERMRSLVESEVIPKQSFEQFEDTYKMAEAQYRQAKEQAALVDIGARKEDREAMEAAVQQATNAVELARTASRRVEATRLDIEATKLAIEQARAAVGLAEVAKKNVEIKAPASGRIEDVLVEKGAVVGAGVPLMVLVEPGKSEIVAEVREEDRLLLRAGLKGLYSVDGLPGEGPFAATVKQVGVAANPMTGLFPVKLAPDASEAPKLKDGMFARGYVDTGVKKGALLVPIEAVLRSEGRKVVYVAVGDLAEKRYVATGLRYPDRVEIVDGVNAGDRVVVTGQVGLSDGAAIVVKAEAE